MRKFLVALLALQVFANPNDPSLDTTAPTVAVTSPTSGATYDAGTSAAVTLSGTSTDTTGTATCRWVNSLGGSGTASTAGDGAWTTSVALTIGTNVITVTCLDPGNNMGTDILTVTRSSSGGGVTLTVCDSGCNGTSVATVFNTAAAGATIEVRAPSVGGSDSFSCGTLSSAGSAGSPITLQPRAGDTITLTSTCSVGGSGNRYIVIGGASGNGFQFLGVGSTSTSGIRASATTPRKSHITIRNNTFTDGCNIINMNANDVLIDGNTFVSIGDDAIDQFGSRWTVRGNLLRDSASLDTTCFSNQPEGTHLDFWQSYDSNGFGAQDLLFENNTMQDVTGGNQQWLLINSTNGSGTSARGLIMRYNVADNVGGGIFIDDNPPGAQPMGHYNSIYNNTMVLLSHGSPPTWQEYCCPLTASSDTRGVNNIFYDAMYQTGARGFAWGSSTNVSQANNLYFDPGNTMTFASPASTESGAVKNQNPLFTSLASGDFTPLTGSPAINAGTALTTVAATDALSGTTLRLTHFWMFSPGYGDGVLGDLICIGSTVSGCTETRVTAIDFTAGTLIISPAISRTVGQSAWLAQLTDGTDVLIGTAPDIGAVETTSVIDVTISMSSATVGVPLTASIVTAGTSGSGSGSVSWSLSGNCSSNCTVETFGTGKGMTFPLNNTNTYVTTEFSPTRPTISMGAYVSFGSIGSSFQTIDQVYYDGTDGSFCVAQTSSSFALRAHSGVGGSSNVGPNISISANTRYWITLRVSPNFCELYVELPNGTFVGQSSLTIGSSVNMNTFRFGRTDSHSGSQPPAANVNRYDDVRVDWTTAPFPMPKP